jgi:hypothetical protein
MKKNEYIAPEIVVVDFEPVLMLSGSKPDIGIEDGEGGEILSNDRRGTWGNLWGDEK